MKKLLSLSLMFILLFTLIGCGKNTEDQYQKIKDRGYIIVGLDDTFAPLGFRENGEIVGFDVDLAKEVGKVLGLDVKFQPINWDLKEQELNSRNIDLIWNGYSITEERKSKVAFSNPYLVNRQVIVVLTNSDIFSKSDLIGKEIGVQRASSALDAVTNSDAIDTIKNSAPIEYDTNDLALRDLEAGRIDAVVVDEILARYYITLKGSNNFRILADDFGKEEYGVGLRKSDISLLEAFNEAYNQVKNDTGISISIKWFGENILK